MQLLRWSGKPSCCLHTLLIYFGMLYNVRVSAVFWTSCDKKKEFVFPQVLSRILMILSSWVVVPVQNGSVAVFFSLFYMCPL